MTLQAAQKSEGEVRQEFVRNLRHSSYNEVDKTEGDSDEEDSSGVSLAAFVDYYGMVGAFIEDDYAFMQLLTKTWDMITFGDNDTGSTSTATSITSSDMQSSNFTSATTARGLELPGEQAPAASKHKRASAAAKRREEAREWARCSHSMEWSDMLQQIQSRSPYQRFLRETACSDYPTPRSPQVEAHGSWVTGFRPAP